MKPVVLVPGWQNSGAGHWQSHWSRLPGAVRVEQDDWLWPKRQAWVDRLAETLTAQREPVLLAAHSLGCIAVAHLPLSLTPWIAGALLVAPADPERRGPLADFAPVPHHRHPWPSVLVASDNDPFCPIRLAGAYARAWGSRLVRLAGAGHINVESGHGEWPEGLALLRSLDTESTPA
ncbi:MAG: alpha/beta hydrolase [Hydrogenophaga sp.]|uniref:RBBP9/YdeN family alpha/beta hydrolase n=1 Tax=Hydrogenophaga sp. TaxID=1904254 RepID=UPI001DA44F55|nr:alpha/beta hydrolase [Hydrogenophaga sp.]MBX3610743.1 alpha/beta hydrolase [Hydrogenophaga sp.]